MAYVIWKKSTGTWKVHVISYLHKEVPQIHTDCREQKKLDSIANKMELDLFALTHPILKPLGSIFRELTQHVLHLWQVI